VRELDRSHAVARFARWSGQVVGSPYAPLVTLVLIGIALYVLPPFGIPEERMSDIHLLIGVLTLLLVFLLEHNERRDTAAVHVKLDEILLALGAEREKIGVEELPAAEVEDLRDQERDEARAPKRS
jgi:low affinity Fe/Cu permease